MDAPDALLRLAAEEDGLILLQGDEEDPVRFVLLVRQILIPPWEGHNHLLRWELAFVTCAFTVSQFLYW